VRVLRWLLAIVGLLLLMVAGAAGALLYQPNLLQPFAGPISWSEGAWESRDYGVVLILEDLELNPLRKEGAGFKADRIEISRPSIREYRETGILHFPFARVEGFELNVPKRRPPKHAPKLPHIVIDRVEVEDLTLHFDPDPPLVVLHFGGIDGAIDNFSLDDDGLHAETLVTADDVTIGIFKTLNVKAKLWADGPDLFIQGAGTIGGEAAQARVRISSLLYKASVEMEARMGNRRLHHVLPELFDSPYPVVGRFDAFVRHQAGPPITRGHAWTEINVELHSGTLRIDKDAPQALFRALKLFGLVKVHPDTGNPEKKVVELGRGIAHIFQQRDRLLISKGHYIADHKELHMRGGLTGDALDAYFWMSKRDKGNHGLSFALHGDGGKPKFRLGKPADRESPFGPSITKKPPGGPFKGLPKWPDPSLSE